ncbi:hypothetical protein [Paraburkholderia sp. J7]|uniref:hypothetical protein n=1 Tax=Paraburkholderia sp. J7 TaxID=2805438 RepID=UPI002AB6036C|nr:hypothetical protein [Paraburkholderia sp. J7]
MNDDPDFLYERVPVVYRLRDADQGYPLRALLRIVAEQAAVIERDIDGLYENWFIETCDDWVVPYLGALIGYAPLAGAHAADLPGNGCGCGCDCGGESGAPTASPLPSARREVANTIRYRRRKGTLGVLDAIAVAVGGWPAQAVEFYRRLALTQNIDFLHLQLGHVVDLRARPDWRGPAFDRRARTIDVRRVDSARTRGVDNIPEVGVFVWRLRAYTVTMSSAYCYEEEAPNCFLFSALGNDTPLHVDPAAPASTTRLPMPIGRDALVAADTVAAGASPALYGPDASLSIWTGTPAVLVDASRIVSADLTDWRYRPQPGYVALDPVLGRIVFPPGEARKQVVRVSYTYAFSADLGGGEYARTLDDPPDASAYSVGDGGEFSSIGEALAKWRTDAPVNAVIEIVDSGVYVEPISITLRAGQSLQLRAASRRRPVLRLLDWQTSAPDYFDVSGDGPSWFALDGVTVTGRGLQAGGSVSGVTIRHSTLVPGWGIACDCGPKRSSEPSIVVAGGVRCLRVERSIVGAIRVERDAVHEDPLRIVVGDSIIDALGPERVALGASDAPCADAVLEIRCSTVIGRVQAQRIDLALNTLFGGVVLACRRQTGCLRFCYVPPGSRTPRRYECQPDGVARAVGDQYLAGDLTLAERDALLKAERLRVAPEFANVRYGSPRYGRLADTCAIELRTGADDGSEMGVLHHLYEPQRAANLRQRLAEYTPAQTDAGLIFAS